MPDDVKLSYLRWLASNIGGGVGLFSSKVSVDLQFRTLTTPLATLTIVQDGNVVELDVDEAAIDHDALLNYDVAQHRTINDSGSATTDLWSADKIQTQIDSAVSGLYEHQGGYDADTNTPDLDVLPLWRLER